MFHLTVYIYVQYFVLLVLSKPNDETMKDKVNDETMKVIGDDDSFENDEHKPTIFELVELGNNITRWLKNPAAIPGHQFVRDLFVYWEDISWLRTFVRLNRKDGQIVYKAIKQQGGPPFLNEEFEDSTLLEAYTHWTKRDIREIRETIHDIDVIWSHMELYLKKEDEYMAPTFYSKKQE
uniref:Uncharacterized protein n=1 Tax=Graphocephala atropunctata TaxID=36148 RepID=A0A1B6LI69_9HEMI